MPDPNARFAVSPDEHQAAIRGARGESWFIARFDEVKGTHQSNVPDDWNYYVPATAGDRLAEALQHVNDLFEEADSELEHLRRALAPAIIVAAERRGFQKAIRTLRDKDRECRANAGTDPDSYDASYDIAADLLETDGLDPEARLPVSATSDLVVDHGQDGVMVAVAANVHVPKPNSSNEVGLIAIPARGRGWTVLTPNEAERVSGALIGAAHLSRQLAR